MTNPGTLAIEHCANMPTLGISMHNYARVNIKNEAPFQDHFCSRKNDRSYIMAVINARIQISPLHSLPSQLSLRCYRGTTWIDDQGLQCIKAICVRSHELSHIYGMVNVSVLGRNITPAFPCFCFTYLCAEMRAPAAVIFTHLYNSLLAFKFLLRFFHINQELFYKYESLCKTCPVSFTARQWPICWIPISELIRLGSEIFHGS